ncbi:HAMP domain-containing protein [Chloroflexota bacterium]|nr:HAMP domain-containing protein [Chloroflexota bacterium]
MTFIKRIQYFFHRLQWKLTFSYTAVTMVSLLILVLILGYLLFSTVLVPLDILNNVLSPKAWIQTVSQNYAPEWRYVLSHEPVDSELLSLLLKDDELQISFLDLFQIGDLQVRARTTGEGSVLILDPKGNLLASSDTELVSENNIGKPLDLGILPGLEQVLDTALAGNVDPERLFVELEPNESFYFAVPYFDESNQDLLGVGVIYFASIPTENDLPHNIMTILSQSVLILLLAAGLIGTLFGFWTAKGMTLRLQKVSNVTDAWSQGDFSEFISDPSGDEISQLANRLNHMAEQLQEFLRRSKEMAVSEERNRLARDLHDSAKQEALAASFHLGTALTLYERDPQNAKGHLIEADRLINSVRSELIDLIHELRPPSRNDDFFDEKLNEYIIEWAHQAGINANLEIIDTPQLRLGIQQAVYRIVQEALANVARHSSAKQVKVTLKKADKRFELSIQDDGIGFDTQKFYDGIGLESMKERAESIGGEINIMSEIGSGTRIAVSFSTNEIGE